jgi:hypothetical protein
MALSPVPAACERYGTRHPPDVAKAGAAALLAAGARKMPALALALAGPRTSAVLVPVTPRTSAAPTAETDFLTRCTGRSARWSMTSIER